MSDEVNLPDDETPEDAVNDTEDELTAEVIDEADLVDDDSFSDESELEATDNEGTESVEMLDEADSIDDDSFSGEGEHEEAAGIITCAKQAIKNNKNANQWFEGSDSGKAIDRAEGLVKDIDALNARYASLVMLDGIYFGPKTRAALKQMGNDPWTTDQSSRQKKLLNAMDQELMWFPH